MNHVTVKIEGLSGTGKTWLAVNLKTYLEQMGFVVEPLTEGRSEDRFVIHEPVPVIKQVMAGRQLYTALGAKRAKPVRLPGVVHPKEIVGEVVYDTVQKPINANHASVNDKGMVSFGYIDDMQAGVHCTGHVDFNREYLLEPTPEPHPDYITVWSFAGRHTPIRVTWCETQQAYITKVTYNSGVVDRDEAKAHACKWAEKEGVVYRD